MYPSAGWRVVVAIGSHPVLFDVLREVSAPRSVKRVLVEQGANDDEAGASPPDCTTARLLPRGRGDASVPVRPRKLSVLAAPAAARRGSGR